MPTATRMRMTAGGGSVVLPTLVGVSSNNIPENNGVARAVPGGTVPGRYIMAWYMGVGTGSCTWSGSGWTLLGQAQNGSGTCIVYGKFIQAGDPTSYSPSASGLTGMAGLIVYENVVSVNANKTEVILGHGSTLTFPAAWATVGVGSMAMIFGGNNNTDDFPVNTTQNGWRRDLDQRRWHYGGAMSISYDPARWTGSMSHWSVWGTTGAVAIMLHGESNASSIFSNVIPSNIRPTVIEAGGIGWNSYLTCPATAQVDDLLVIGAFRSSNAAFPLGYSEDGWWGLVNYFPGHNAFAAGRFVRAGEPGTHVIRLTTASNQSRGYVLIRGVNKLSPLVRTIHESGGNSVTYPTFTAGVNTLTFCSMGANIGDGGSNFDSTTGWTGVYEHNRWAPWGSMLSRTTTDGEVVSGLAWDVQGGTTGYGALVELRGA